MSEFHYSTKDPMTQPDYDGKYWDEQKKEYKYKYLSSTGKTKFSSWTKTTPRDFIKRNNCAILSSQSRGA